MSSIIVLRDRRCCSIRVVLSGYSYLVLCYKGVRFCLAIRTGPLKIKILNSYAVIAGVPFIAEACITLETEPIGVAVEWTPSLKLVAEVGGVRADKDSWGRTNRAY